MKNSGGVLTLYILTYNRPDFLHQCLASIEKQTYTNFKIVVLDNASTKNYVSVLEHYNHMNIEYIRHPINIQSYGNFKYAVTRPVDTSYIMVFHDDDIMHPELLEREISILDENPKLTWVGCELSPFRGSVSSFRREASSKKFDLMSVCDLACRLKGVRGRLRLAFSSVIYRVSALSEIDLDFLLNDCGIIADRPLLMELANLSCCAATSDKLVYYRIHPNQDSKIGPQSDDNILGLYRSYHDAFSSCNDELLLHRFYRKSAFGIPDSWWRLKKNRRNSRNFLAFILKARSYELLKISDLMVYYPLGVLHRFFIRSVNFLKKLLIQPSN